MGYYTSILTTIKNINFNLFQNHIHPPRQEMKIVDMFSRFLEVEIEHQDKDQ